MLAILLAGSLFGGLFGATPDLQSLRLPPGFRIDVFASDVGNARQMALGERTLFVGSRTAGNVYALVDTDGDGVADRKYVIARDLDMPSGIAFRDGSLYVAAVNRILRYDAIETHLDNPPSPVVITDKLPSDAHHGWKYLAFGPDGFLYVPVGAPCNVCLPPDARYETILRMNPTTGDWTVYAQGVRNSVGFDFDPATGDLWFTDNGRDWLGDDAPPDELNHAPKAGLHFGFPYRHGVSVVDPEFGRRAPQQAFTPPAAQFGAHVAPLGMTFYRGKQFPEDWRHSIVVAEHGSWNRSRKVGYRLVRVILDGDRVASIEPFVTGWLNERTQRAWGRPDDVINAPDGSLLVSDDTADMIYRISYSRK